MNEMQKQALPGYKDLADKIKTQGEQLDKQDKSIAGLKTQLERNNALLTSLNFYHGDPDKGTAYLKQISDSLNAVLSAILCIKAKITKHMSIGLRITFVTLFFAGVALVTEVASKGQYPLFSTTWNYLKGVF